jgi:hypothetical protein
MRPEGRTAAALIRLPLRMPPMLNTSPHVPFSNLLSDAGFGRAPSRRSTATSP